MNRENAPKRAPTFRSVGSPLKICMNIAEKKQGEDTALPIVVAKRGSRRKRAIAPSA
jgi:hypothetical protein